MVCGFNCALYENGSIWWILRCPEVWGGGRRMRRAWFVCRFLCYNMYVCNKTFSTQQTTFAPVAQMLCQQSANKQIQFDWQEIRTEKHKRGGQHPGSYLWKRWRHVVLPVARWGWGSPEQSWTGPGRCGPSTDRPAASLTDLLRRTWADFIKCLRGQ